MQRSHGDGGEVLVADAHAETRAGGHPSVPPRGGGSAAATGASKRPSVASPHASVSSSAAAS